MLYQEVLPHQNLKKWILNYWQFKSPVPEQSAEPVPISHKAPADGCVSLLLIYNSPLKQRQALLVGPSGRMIESMVYPNSIYIGIRALPGMAGAAFGADARTLLNGVDTGEAVLRHTGLAPVLDSLMLDFSDFSQLDRCLLNTLPLKPEAEDAEVQKAVAAIMSAGGRGRLTEIKQQSSISERQLQKRFLQKVGLSMKEFAGVCKLRATLIEAWVEHKDFFDTIYQQGYYDQAHFLHHLKKISKNKPAAFKAHVQQILHQGVAPFQELY